MKAFGVWFSLRCSETSNTLQGGAAVEWTGGSGIAGRSPAGEVKREDLDGSFLLHPTLKLPFVNLTRITENDPRETEALDKEVVKMTKNTGVQLSV